MKGFPPEEQKKKLQRQKLPPGLKRLEAEEITAETVEKRSYVKVEYFSDSGWLEIDEGFVERVDEDLLRLYHGTTYWGIEIKKSLPYHR